MSTSGLQRHRVPKTFQGVYGVAAPAFLFLWIASALTDLIVEGPILLQVIRGDERLMCDRHGSFLAADARLQGQKPAFLDLTHVMYLARCRVAQSILHGSSAMLAASLGEASCRDGSEGCAVPSTIAAPDPVATRWGFDESLTLFTSRTAALAAGREKNRSTAGLSRDTQCVGQFVRSRSRDVQATSNVPVSSGWRGSRTKSPL